MAGKVITYAEVMKEMRAKGTAQNVKVYRRHGAEGDLFGLSFASLRKLGKRIGKDCELALRLWDSGNDDARILATMIADPRELKPSTVDKWIKDVHYYVLSDQLAELISRSPIALEKMEQLMDSSGEFQRACGYTMLASALENGVAVPDKDCRRYLRVIEAEIHTSPNRARYCMNNAVIAVGVYKPSLTREAEATAARIGKVVVDHGDTSCRTPDAVTYIRKSLVRKKV
ncbi:MAG: DNA alkylation repair protein [Actinobacteria bacterium]|nr:DNA alkylation repair protein [Actinomycetota bacterium]